MKRFFTALLACCMIATLSLTVFAQEASAELQFELPDQVPTEDAAAEEIAAYYANTSYFTALSEAINAVLRDQTVTANGQTYDTLIYIRGFRITDFAVPEGSDAETEAQATAAAVREALAEATEGTYLSLITVDMGVCFRLTEAEPADPETEEEPEIALTVYVGIATPQSTSECVEVFSQIIAPKLREWSGKTFGEQLIALNDYLLSGEFSSAKRAYSAVSLLKNKSGDSFDYTAAAYLFLSQLGYRCEVITGTDLPSVPAAWLLVRYKSAYYHCDFYGNGIFNTNGTYAGYSQKYLAVSTEKIRDTHTIDNGKYAEQIEAATADYDLTEQTAPVEKITRTDLKELIDAVTSAVIDELRYTSASFQPFAAAYEAANVVFGNGDSSEEALSIAYFALQSAYEQLEKDLRVNKSALAALLNETPDRSLYVGDSYYAYQTALTDALSVYENADAEQEQVDAATERLRAAKNALVRILDKETLTYYVKNLDSFLYSLTLELPEDLIQTIKAMRDEFQTAYDNDQITEALLKDAAERYDVVSKQIEAAEQTHASGNAVYGDNGETDAIATGSDPRSIFVLIAAVTVLLALGAVILYFKPPKFLR